MLSLMPYQFHGPQTAGVVIFILNLVLIAILCTLMLIRFVPHPRIIKPPLATPPPPAPPPPRPVPAVDGDADYLHGAVWRPSQGAFARGGHTHGLLDVCRGTLIFTTAIWVVLSSRSSAKLLETNRAMLLMIYNTMLTGTIASDLAQSQPPVQRLPIIIAGITYQGLGWIIIVVSMAWFVGSLIQNGLGQPDQMPPLFIPVGSAGFATVTIIGCARALPRGYAYFATHPQGKETGGPSGLDVNIPVTLCVMALRCGVPGEPPHHDPDPERSTAATDALHAVMVGHDISERGICDRDEIYR
ncbi:hypothetical protein DL762_010171 [Monosporascus cannonballus]|uniref:Uncharacterized protein n=1 Tax=Monosporascus cannonballus TaxID=155416 RepID=A0ABY0GRB5_9PEZI|nr:hypothetical protein DL762_010171 [Monosporascus cannonballus]